MPLFTTLKGIHQGKTPASPGRTVRKTIKMTDQEIKEMDQFVLQLKAESKFGKEITAKVINDVDRYGLEPTESFYDWTNQHYYLACLEFLYYGRK